MRLGLNSAEEGEKVIEILNRYPLKGVIIHARTGSQIYSGSVDLKSFGTLYSACRHETTYNGDLFSSEDLKRLQLLFPSLDNFMLGRGALRDPFLPSELKGHSVPEADRIMKIKAFHDQVFEYYSSVLSGDRHLCDRMNEFWSYLSVPLDPSGRFLKKLKKCHSISTYKDLVNQLFSTIKV